MFGRPWAERLVEFVAVSLPDPTRRLSYRAMSPHDVEALHAIWADPEVSRNCHTIEVDADSARFTLSIENVPSENPKTGRITALSALAALRKLHAPLRIGT